MEIFEEYPYWMRESRDIVKKLLRSVLNLVLQDEFEVKSKCNKDDAELPDVIEDKGSETLPDGCSSMPLRCQVSGQCNDKSLDLNHSWESFEVSATSAEVSVTPAIVVCHHSRICDRVIGVRNSLDIEKDNDSWKELLIIEIKSCDEKVSEAILPKSSNIVKRHCSKTATACVTMVDFFKAKSDIYKGITVNTEEFSFSNEEFEEKLDNALAMWMKSGIRGIWFRVQIKDSSYIPILVKNGFVFHHAKQSYAMLTRWLPEDEPNLLPQFPHTHVGVGGLVVNEKNEVLVIQERFQRQPHWKLPGGYSTPGEEFAETAQREVFEETGIVTEFVSVVSFRHYHKHLFECSDIYVVCHMRPKNDTVTRSQEEVALCQWMDIDMYRTHPDVTDFNRFIINTFLESQKLGATIIPSQIRFYTKDFSVNVYTVKPTEASSLQEQKE